MENSNEVKTVTKARSKFVLEGAILELAKNEYDRYLSVDEMITNIDAQSYLGGVDKVEAEQCMNVLNRVQELKNNEITLLQTLSRNIFAYERPAVENKEENKEQIEGQISVDEVTGTAADLNKEKAMKGMEDYNVDNVVTEAKEE